MSDIDGCVKEIAATMIQLLVSSHESERRIVDRYVSDIPNVDPQQILLQLRVCYGPFPKLEVRRRRWQDIGLRSEGRGALYQLIPMPGLRPVYFTVMDLCVVRVTPARYPRTP